MQTKKSVTEEVLKGKGLSSDLTKKVLVGQLLKKEIKNCNSFDVKLLSTPFVGKILSKIPVRPTYLAIGTVSVSLLGQGILGTLMLSAFAYLTYKAYNSKEIENDYVKHGLAALFIYLGVFF